MFWGHSSLYPDKPGTLVRKHLLLTTGAIDWLVDCIGFVCSANTSPSQTAPRARNLRHLHRRHHR
eukprot:COSAG02_NODE_611_length_19555_cov_34.449270_18_plen_65_part_00